MKTHLLLVASMCLFFSLSRTEEPFSTRIQQGASISSPRLEKSNWIKDHPNFILAATILMYAGLPILHYYFLELDKRAAEAAANARLAHDG